jgi:tRNA pseudouridine55 synthase
MATGVLVLGVNRATRLLGHLALTEKAYDATVRLGVATTTDDAEGGVLATAPPGSTDVIDRDTLDAVLAQMIGEVQQVPSTVSAIKVDGERAYKRVRAGETVELAARPVTIHEISIGTFTRGDGVLDLELSVRCSSGTYVRAIARDLGATLGVGGHLTALRRTAVGPAGLGDATPLADLEDVGTVSLMPMSQVARRFFSSIDVDEDSARAVGFGRSLDVRLPVSGPVAVLGPTGDFLALYEHRADDPAGAARPVAVFV